MPVGPICGAECWGSGGPAVVVAVIALLIWAPIIKWRWVRIVFRVLGGTAALYVLVIVGIGMALNTGSHPQYRTVTSPNGLHQATLMYQGGFLGRDISIVEITRKGCCRHLTAYEYEGPADLQGTTLVWLDDSHLRIEYHSDSDRYQRCEARVGDITIICTPTAAENN
jgi:hypothetical protein